MVECGRDVHINQLPSGETIRSIRGAELGLGDDRVNAVQYSEHGIIHLKTGAFLSTHSLRSYKVEKATIQTPANYVMSYQ